MRTWTTPMVQIDGSTRLCDACLAMFTSNRPFQRFCSSKCRERGSKIEARYNISMSQWWFLRDKQDFKCAIAGCDETALTVDHDHACCSEPGRSCGECVRGLICDRHNKTLGMVRDNVEELKALITYLEMEN